MALISYKIYLEMAQMGRGDYHGDVSKKILNFDEDDLDFLNQFDRKLWPAAMAQRWDLLHGTLKKLHDIRKSKIEEGSFVEKISNFLKTGSSSGLPPKLIERLKSDHGPIPMDTDSRSEFKHVSSTESDPEKKSQEIKAKKLKIIKNIAEDEAFEFIKKQTENLKELGLDEEAEFVFPADRRTSRSPTKVKAKPFLNRMYHRLERTEGESHIDGSENSGTGIYGYDLSHPKEIVGEEGKTTRKTTRGTNWVGDSQWSIDLKDYLQHTSHGHLGWHRDAHDAEWLPVNIGSNELEDPTYDWLLEKEIKTQINSAKERLGVKSISKDQEKEAKNAAKQALKSRIETQGLYAPPVPGISKEDRKYKIVGDKVIKPLVYLPHDENGKLLLKPSTYLKAIKKEIRNEDGVMVPNPKYDAALRKAKEVWGTEERPDMPVMAPTDPEDKLQGTEGIKTFAPTLNKNARGQSYINHLTDRGQKIIQDNLSDLKTVSFAGNSFQVVPAVYYGILYCLNSSNCAGGAPERFRRLLGSKLIDVYQFIYTQLLSNLGSVKKWGQLGMAPGEPGYAALLHWAKDRTTDILQNLSRTSFGQGGEGTRRRGYGTSTVAAPQDAEGSSIDTSERGYASRGGGRGNARVGVGQSHTAKNFQDIYSQLEDKEKEIEAAQKQMQDIGVEGAADPDNDAHLSPEEQQKKLQDYLEKLGSKAGGQTNLIGIVQRAQDATDDFYDLAKEMLWAIWNKLPRNERKNKVEQNKDINALVKSWKEESLTTQEILLNIKTRDDFKRAKALEAAQPAPASSPANASVATPEPTDTSVATGRIPWRAAPAAEPVRPLPRATARPTSQTSSPLSRLRRPAQPEQPEQPTVDWNDIKDLPISERVKYFKEKLR
jgi:hypothetical protein